jgi:hypothetical protein
MYIAISPFRIEVGGILETPLGLFNEVSTPLLSNWNPFNFSIHSSRDVLGIFIEYSVLLFNLGHLHTKKWLAFHLEASEHKKSHNIWKDVETLIISLVFSALIKCKKIPLSNTSNASFDPKKKFNRSTEKVCLSAKNSKLNSFVLQIATPINFRFMLHHGCDKKPRHEPLLCGILRKNLFLPVKNMCHG